MCGCDSIADTVMFFFFQAEDGIRDKLVTGVQTCALPIWHGDIGDLGGTSRRRSGLRQAGGIRPVDKGAQTGVRLPRDRPRSGRGVVRVESLVDSHGRAYRGRPTRASPPRCGFPKLQTRGERAVASRGELRGHARGPGGHDPPRASLPRPRAEPAGDRSEEHTSELQSLAYLVCRLLLEKKKNIHNHTLTLMR